MQPCQAVTVNTGIRQSVLPSGRATENPELYYRPRNDVLFSMFLARPNETKPHRTMLARSFAISAQRFAARRLMATGKEIRFGAFIFACRRSLFCLAL
jgi:hypothetical protein